MLNEIEERILDDIFEMNINNGRKLSIENYDLEEKDNPDYKQKWSEFGYYLLKLKSLGYLKFDENILTKGGRQNQKYRNNIIGVWTERIEIDKDGISYVVKQRETFKDKAIAELKTTGKSFYKQLRDGLIGFIVGIIVAWVSGLFG